jgi:hypothetical protein
MIRDVELPLLKLGSTSRVDGQGEAQASLPPGTKSGRPTYGTRRCMGLRASLEWCSKSSASTGV